MRRFMIGRPWGGVRYLFSSDPYCWWRSQDTATQSYGPRAFKFFKDRMVDDSNQLPIRFVGNLEKV